MNEWARKKTKRLTNPAIIYGVGSIDLKQYLKSLSSFVGDFAGKKTKKNRDRDGTVIIENDFDDNQWCTLKFVNSFTRCFLNTDILVCIFSGFQYHLMDLDLFELNSCGVDWLATTLSE